eukprot:352492-Chlamydomonas_euryale.AAC.2
MHMQALPSSSAGHPVSGWHALLETRASWLHGCLGCQLADVPDCTMLQSSSRSRPTHRDTSASLASHRLIILQWHSNASTLPHN